MCYQQLVHTLIKYKFVESNTGLVFFRTRCQSVLARQGSFCFWIEPFVISLIHVNRDQGVFVTRELAVFSVKREIKNLIHVNRDQGLFRDS